MFFLNLVILNPDPANPKKTTRNERAREGKHGSKVHHESHLRGSFRLPISSQESQGFQKTCVGHRLPT